MLLKKKSWQEKEEEKGRGFLLPQTTKHYVMVKVGQLFTTFNRGNNPLTADFREAICYRDKRPGEMIPPFHNLKKARKDAETYGGKLVRVTVTLTDYDQE